MNPIEWHILVMLNWMVAVTVLGAFMSMYDCFDDVVETQGIWKRKLEEFEKLTDNSLAIMKGQDNYVKNIAHVPFNVVPENTVIHQCGANDNNQTITSTPSQYFERLPFEAEYNLSSFLHMVYGDIVWLFYSDCYGNL